MSVFSYQLILGIFLKIPENRFKIFLQVSLFSHFLLSFSCIEYRYKHKTHNSRIGNDNQKGAVCRYDSQMEIVTGHTGSFAGGTHRPGIRHCLPFPDPVRRFADEFVRRGRGGPARRGSACRLIHHTNTQHMEKSSLGRDCFFHYVNVRLCVPGVVLVRIGRVPAGIRAGRVDLLSTGFA